MVRYDYRQAVKEDLTEYIVEYLDYSGTNIDDLTEDDLQTIYDDAFVSDQVTGNASGSYTFSTWNAEENLCHNMDLAYDAYIDFGYDGITSYNAEAIDVTIRCYLLAQVFDEVIEELREEA